MTYQTVWLLMQEGFNENEIAAAAGMHVEAASALVCHVLNQVRSGRSTYDQAITTRTNELAPIGGN